MSMEEFLKLGLGWVVKTAHFEYKRSLGMGEHFLVRTWVEGIEGSDVEVHFEIAKKAGGKLSCSGWCLYTLGQTGHGPRREDSGLDCRQVFNLKRDDPSREARGVGRIRFRGPRRRTFPGEAGVHPMAAQAVPQKS